MKTSVLLVCLSVCVSAALGQGYVMPGQTPSGGTGGLVPGGLYPISHAEARPVAIFAIGEMGQQYRLLAITRKHAQVVQGTLYHLTLLVWNSFSSTGPRVESCEIRVHDIPWMNTRELIHRECTPRSMPGQGAGYGRRT